MRNEKHFGYNWTTLQKKINETRKKKLIRKHDWNDEMKIESTRFAAVVVEREKKR